MPNYTYECVKCGLRFDSFVPMAERHNVEHCGEKAIKHLSAGSGVLIDQNYKDAKGTPIYFPSVAGGKGHFDRALQKTFYSKKEKCEYLKSKGYVMDGSQTSQKVKHNIVRKCEKGNPIGVE